MKRLLRQILIPLLTAFITAIITSIIVAVFRLRLSMFLRYVWKQLESLKSWVLDKYNYVASVDGEWPFIVKSACFALFASFISFIIAFITKKCNTKRKVNSNFKYSFGIVKQKMLPAFVNMVSKNPKEKNQRIDRYIQSPIEYVNETLNGNKVPGFNPDDPSQDAMFNTNIKYIVAITAENPNLWLDPTVCFYMANCYAVSLMNQTNKAIDEANKVNKNIKKMVVKNRDMLEDKMETIEKDIIDKLSDSKPIAGFEFVRFFMFTDAQNKSCENAVFPSLKAAQDLFRTHSFYINKDCIKTEKTQSENWKEFSAVVTRLWSLFEDTAFIDDGIEAQNVIVTRKKEIIPEFLFLYYNNKVEMRSYLDGNPVKVEIKKNTKYSQYFKKCFKKSQVVKRRKYIKKYNYGDKFVISDIDKLVSLLASYVKDNEYQDDSTFINNNHMVNNNNAFIDWEIA